MRGESGRKATGGKCGDGGQWEAKGGNGRRQEATEGNWRKWEASGVNAGGLGGIGWGNVPDLQAFLTMGSLEEFKTLQLDNGYDIEFRQSGTLQAIHTPDQYEYARDRMLRPSLIHL